MVLSAITDQKKREGRLDVEIYLDVESICFHDTENVVRMKRNTAYMDLLGSLLSCKRKDIGERSTPCTEVITHEIDGKDEALEVLLLRSIKYTVFL